MAFDLQVVLDLVDKFTGPLQGSIRELEHLEHQIDRVEKGTNQMMKGVAVGAAGMAIAAPLLHAANAASDLNESISKKTAVFKTDQAVVNAWAVDSAHAFGLTRQEAIESASTLGNLFVGMSIGTKSASKMSTSLVTLAGDLASFNNTSVSDAVEALTSGMTGEMEPLKKFGVNIDDTALKTKAFQLGLSKNVKADLSPAQKSMAAYYLILDQTKTAQGDFSKTAGGLANATRIVQAQMGDAWANIGQFVLPVMGHIVHMAAMLLTGFNDFVRHHPTISRVLILTATAIAGILIVAGSLMVLMGALNVAWGNAVGGLALFRSGLLATRTAVVLTTTSFWQNLLLIGAWTTANNAAEFAALRNATGLAAMRLVLIGVKVNLLGAATAAWAFIAPLLANPLTWVVIAVVALGAALWGLWRVLTPVREMLGKLWDHIKYGVGFIVGLMEGLGLNLIRGLVRGILSGLKLVWNTVHTVASGLLGRFKAFFGIHSPSKVFAEQGQFLLDGLTGGMKDRAPALYDFLTRVVGPKVLDALKSGWDRAKAFGGNMLSTVGGWFGVGGGGATGGGGGGGSFNPASLKLPAGTDSGSTIARAAVAGLTAGWAESIPGYCSRFVRQVFSKALGPQTAKLFSTSAIDTERVWKRQGLAKTLNEIGGKAALRAGDVLFQGFGSGGYGHTGIYAGNGMVAQNTTMAGGGKKLLPLSSFGTITSVGRLPDAPRPSSQTNNSSSTHVTISNVHLPNVAHPHEFVGALQNFMEANQ